MGLITEIGRTKLTASHTRTIRIHDAGSVFGAQLGLGGIDDLRTPYPVETHELVDSVVWTHPLVKLSADLVTKADGSRRGEGRHAVTCEVVHIALVVGVGRRGECQCSDSRTSGATIHRR